MKILALLSLFLLPITLYSQKTMVEGVVTDGVTGEPMPFVTVRFQDSKIGTFTDTAGYFNFNTYYATDSLTFSFSGYIKQTVPIKLDESQEVNITMEILQTDIDEVYVRPPDELPSTRLHKKVVAHKRINNKEKLDSYEYEVYNKIQLDLNNIGEKFKERDIVQKLDVVMEYLDSSDNGKSFLPVIISESVSDFYFKNNPQKKKEVVKATRVSGVENLQINQFLGDMYLDVNIYDNYIDLFNKSFISPVANFARSYYRFYLDDSTFIDNQWCYKLSFKPKRTGDATLVGEMWIHDTTYAVKQFQASLAPNTNINYVQGLYIEHSFDMVAPEVWMLTGEKMIADLKVTKKTDVYGFYGRRHSTRENYVVNQARPEDFYKSNSTVELQEGANHRSDEYWAEIRHEPLSEQEQGVDNMIDSLNDMRFFKMLKNIIYLATTGYYPMKKLELGSAFSLVTNNPVEGWRTALALRTSNDFSRRLELGGSVAYGFGDQKFKYGGRVRFNISPKKRGMLSAYYNYDLEQIGQSVAIGSTFGTLLRTGPLDKLTFVEKIGFDLEKDFGKDFIVYGGFEWKEYTALGVANYLRPDSTDIGRIQSTEFTARFRWAKNEEFISGAFDRTSTGSKYPVISVQGVFGIKDLFGADYNYQKYDLIVEQKARIGVLGRIRYSVNFGYINGTAAYPFLNVHAGNQSYWLMTNSFNMMNFFEFISDKYVTALLENHWDGLILDRIPLIKKLKWRTVTSVRAAFGSIDDKHQTNMILPEFTKSFGQVPYVECSIGIENIFTLIRVDAFWRLTHRIPTDPLEKNIFGLVKNPNFGIRARYSFNF